MINLGILNRQHIGIKEEVMTLESEIKKGKEAMNVSNIVFYICKLTGLLKIHLLEEDTFLYPDLLKNSDHQIHSLTKSYMQDMANLVDEYTIFKCTYNSEWKIVNNMDKFLTESELILTALKERLSKEEVELFVIINENNYKINERIG